MEAAVELLEAKFQKADSDLTHLTRKLELRCQEQAEGENRKNPLELLRKVKVVKDEYQTLVKEMAEIQKAQSEAMDFFRSQLPIAMQALQQLQSKVGMTGSEEDKAMVDELQNMLGIQPHMLTAVTTGHAPGALEASAADQTSDTAASESVDSVCHQPDGEHTAQPATCPSALEDPVTVRAQLRAESSELVAISQEEFESVSELIRGRVKLCDVNSVYRMLFTHFKEEGNSQPLLPTDMHKMGMRVSGATGKAKLKVLRALKLLTISSKDEVRLL